MMLEQGKKIETIKNESIPSVSRSMSHAAEAAASIALAFKANRCALQRPEVLFMTLL